MTVRFWEGKPLFVGGRIAQSADCCCDPPPIGSCTRYRGNGIGETNYHVPTVRVILSGVTPRTANVGAPSVNVTDACCNAYNGTYDLDILDVPNVYATAAPSLFIQNCFPFDDTCANPSGENAEMTAFCGLPGVAGSVGGFDVVWSVSISVQGRNHPTFPTCFQGVLAYYAFEVPTGTPINYRGTFALTKRTSGPFIGSNLNTFCTFTNSAVTLIAD